MSALAPPRMTVERVPPRRRRPKRSVWRRTVWPLVKFAVIAAAAVLLAQAVAGRVARPIKLLNTEYREKQLVAAELESLKKENESLERRIKYLQTPRGAAQAARRLGYVKPGEITLVLPPEPAKTRNIAPRGRLVP